MNSDPFCARSEVCIGGTGPEELPNVTHKPRGFKQSSEAGKVSLPTES